MHETVLFHNFVGLSQEFPAGLSGNSRSSDEKFNSHQQQQLSGCRNPDDLCSILSSLSPSLSRTFRAVAFFFRVVQQLLSFWLVPSAMSSLARQTTPTDAFVEGGVQEIIHTAILYTAHVMDEHILIANIYSRPAVGEALVIVTLQGWHGL